MTKVESITVKVDFGLPPHAMIQLGSFRYIDHLVTPHYFGAFPHEGKMTFEIGAFHFDAYVQSHEALRRIQHHDPQHSWRPALIEHLIWFSQAWPHEHPLCALGSSQQDGKGRRVPCLTAFNSTRNLVIDVCRWQRGWECHYRFLAYRSPKRRFLSWLRRK